MENDNDENLTMTFKNKKEGRRVGGQQMLSILEVPLFNTTIDRNQKSSSG
jgi:hypothetical protein